MNNIPDNFINQDVDQTLEVLLAPGQRIHLSPLVETAQLFLLTGEWPDERKRHESIRAILKKNEDLITQLAKTWKKTRNDFSPENYETESYLQMYALYYFSTNVSKMQIMMHELARRGQLSKELNIIDIGVGTGSTAIAMLDFLYSWGLACELHNQPFPVERFGLRGIDKSKPALEISAKMVSAYQQAIQRRADLLSTTSVGKLQSTDLLEKISHWFERITWERVDLESQCVQANNETNLVVLSNVWNELTQPKAKCNAEDYLRTLSNESIVVLIEPGDKEKSKDLMRWRANFLSSNSSFISIAPCGEEISKQQIEVCSSCWASRRESFHQTSLYLSFRTACEKEFGDNRSFDEYDNNLLSWSYVILKKFDRYLIKEDHYTQRTLIPGNNIIEPINLRALGKFYQKPEKNGYQLVDYTFDKDPYQDNDRQWDEYIKVCSLLFPGTELVVFERNQGFQIPRLQYGQEILVSNIEVDLFNCKPKQFRLIPKNDDQTTIKPVTQRVISKDKFLNGYDRQTEQTINELSYRLFGFLELRKFQHEILSRVLCGESVLGIAATGGGKSECYILPAMILPGITIVVSPLRSLMTDQYDQRISQRYGLGDLATYINGDVPFNEREARLKRMELGYYKLVYFTPEQLERGYILDSLRRANGSIGIRYLALDECHCISQWGHDFRPSYLNIVNRLKEYAISPVIIALTATASPRVREDICEELELDARPVDQGGNVFVYSSNRPEINLEVRVKHSTDEKISDLLDEIRRFQENNRYDQNPGAAIVFMPYTGGNPENTWGYLPEKSSSRQGRNSAGVLGFASYLERVTERRLAIYHGQMENETRKTKAKVESSINERKRFGDFSGRTRNQEQKNFIESISNEIDIMVATKGFGMGIDKPNIRLVIHRSPTTNLEAYAQEAGRAGRDGEMATAILYYSPDATTDESEKDPESKGQAYQTHVSSDHEIQENFLRDRYIRREDVIVMRAFLSQVNHRLTIRDEKNQTNRTYIYFTCDETIDFFNKCQTGITLEDLPEQYCWPKFPERVSNGYESGEHRAILDRGHQYTQKKEYLNRILAALFRIRPTIAGNKGQSFLESLQETGAKVKNGELLCDWNKILHSNGYFGEIFRKNQITQKEFLDALSSPNLLDFAKRLNLTIKELASLLSDIKSFEGHFVNGDWQSSILKFSFISAPLWGPAEGKESLSDWRDYAGAYKRSSTLIENAKRAKHNKPMLDDYFSWKEVSKSSGWEVLPGPAFDDYFPEFLTAFMELHNERMQNDWASYYRLLTDYIGVSEDGSISREDEQKDCLRSVLLGYLESYEVVVDGKCYSCSNCVPDGNYGKYSKELRETSVTRMNPLLITMFNELKEYQNQVPQFDVIDKFFDQMSIEESEGRSIYRYFIGWSGKMLDENPDHKTAKWLRIEGMIRNVIPLQLRELLNLVEQLIIYLPESFLSYLVEGFSNLDSTVTSEPGLLKICVQLSRRLCNYQDEAKFLELLVSQYKRNTKEENLVYEYSSCLAELFSSTGPIRDPIKYQYWCLSAARSALKYEDGLKWYEKITTSWNMQKIETEINEQGNKYQNSYNQAALIVAWMKVNQSQKKYSFIEWVNKQPEAIVDWPVDAQKAILPFYPEELILNSENLLEIFLTFEQNEKLVLAFGLRYLGSHSCENPKILQRLTRAVSSYGQSVSNIIRKYINDESRISEVLLLMMPFINTTCLKDLLCWQQEFVNSINNDQRVVADSIRSFIPSMARADDGVEAISSFQNVVLNYARFHEDIEKKFLQYWLPVYIEDLHLLNTLLSDLFNMGLFGEKLSENVLDAIIRNGNMQILTSVNCDALPIQWENSIFLAFHLQQFIEMLQKNPGNHKIEYFHLVKLRASFDWQNDSDQADMLIAIFIELRKKMTSTWKTPSQMLVEVLVMTGRSSLAKEIVKLEHNLFIEKGGRKYTAMNYISKYNLPERITEIAPVFTLISEKMLRGFYI